MRKKINFLMLTLIAMVTSLVFSSCSKDYEPTENYYFQLTDVNTNGVDVDGNSVASSFNEEWIAANHADSQGRITLGKYSRENAIKSFDLTIDALKGQYQEIYAGKNLLPQGCYIDYNFALLTQAGSTVKSSSIRVTNNGASSY